MAVQPQTPYKEYTANGSTKSFALEFDCDNQDHLIVLVDGVEPVVGTWSLSGGSVVFGTAPGNGKKITIQRNTPFRRDEDFQSYDNSFRPPGVNNGFDKIWLKLQELGVADWILHNRIDALKAYVDQQDSELQQNIDNLKIYVDDKDDELRAYLLAEIQKQGVALDQLDEYYNYLMQRLAQIAVDKGWDASFVVDASGKNQQEINNLLKAANSITPREFGGKPNDPAFDNKYALQACSDSKLPIVLDGFYYTTESPVFGSDSTIKGLGETKSGIVKVGNNVSDTESVVVSPGVIDNYHVDAILIVKGRDSVVDGTSFAKNVDFDSFSLKRYQCSPVVSVCYGLFAPRIAQSKLTKMPILNTLDDGSRVGYAVRVVTGWMLSWDRVDATGVYAFHFGSDTDGHGYIKGGGTSNTFTSCWAMGARKSAWRFHGYTYSNLISCGGDYIGNAANKADFVFIFYASYMGVINCSTEQVYGRLINANDSSSITVINPHFKLGIYGDGTLDALVHVSGNARLNIIGGEITPHNDATNPPYRSQYNSILRTQDVVESFTFSVSKTQYVANKTQVALFSGNSEFIHEKGGVKKCWAFDPSVLEQSYDENGYKTAGSIELTSQKSTVKLTNFDACRYTDPIQLGRMRVWWANVNNSAALYFKAGGDPESETDGTLLNTLRGVGSEFAVTRITGQHFIRSDSNKPFWWNGSGWFDALGNSAITAKPTIQGLKTPTTLAEQVAVNDSIVAALVTLGLVTDSRT